MIPIWFIENEDGTVSFYEPTEGEGIGFAHTGTYVYRKATFVYPPFTYEWIKFEVDGK